LLKERFEGDETYHFSLVTFQTEVTDSLALK